MATATLNRNVKKITERVSIGDSKLRVDRDKSIIHGVKIIGLESKNGRRYLREALTEACSMYEGSRVNVNHPRGNPGAPRDYQDRMGNLADVAMQPDGLYGDMHFNPKHPMAEQLVWDAENKPGNVGLSHNIEGKTRYENGKTIVESITRVQSVDIVADPATTNGLFESEQQTMPKSVLEILEAAYGDKCKKWLTEMDMGAMPVESPAEATSGDQLQAAIEQMVLGVIRDNKLDAAGKAAKVKEILKAMDKLAGGDAPEKEKPAEDEGASESLQNQVKTLREQLDEMQAKEAAATLAEQITTEIAEAKLPEALITDVFRESLRTAKTPTDRKKLIEDRQAIARGYGGSRPVSRDSSKSLKESRAAPDDAKAFLEAITK